MKKKNVGYYFWKLTVHTSWLYLPSLLSLPLSASAQAWQIHEYSGSSGLDLAQEKLIPSIVSPRDVLVKVHAASVNPIDVQMAAGYGRNLINLYKTIVNQEIGSSEFPLTLGDIGWIGHH